MKAQFIGHDGSLGFRRNVIYDIKINSMRAKFGNQDHAEVIVVHDLNSRNTAERHNPDAPYLSVTCTLSKFTEEAFGLPTATKKK